MVVWDHLWINVNLITMDMNMGKGNCYPNALGVIKNAAIATQAEQIAWLGPLHELTHPHSMAKQVHDMQGKWLSPGLIDCHTHLVYAGNRSEEFALRMQGISYQQIASQGGGILNTVRETRAASFKELYEQSQLRLRQFLKEGVTTIEIKSGYGLNRETEIKQLQVIKKLKENLPVDIAATFLGAHAVPPEFYAKADTYMDFLCNELLPELVELELLDAVDIYCEKIAFNLYQTERYLQAASAYKIPVKIHAEQLSNSGACQLAAGYQALSADHLEYLDEKGVAAMAEANMVAVLLPGAFYCLRETQLPPIELLRQYEVPIAIASDCNPGSSPISSLLICMNLAANLFSLGPDEVLSGVTKYAARALGLEDRGRLQVGLKGDLVIWDIGNPYELVYQMGQNYCYQVVKNGKPI